MASSRDASDPLAEGTLASDPSAARRWSISQEAPAGALTLRLSGHMDRHTVVEAIEALAEPLRQRGAPTAVIVDLLDVDGYDVDAPVAAAKVGASIARLIARVEIIVERQVVRIASISAARLLGLDCTVRRER